MPAKRFSVMELDYTKERRIMSVFNEDLPVARRISKLQIMTIKAYPSSPIQKAIIAAILSASTQFDAAFG